MMLNIEGKAYKMLHCVLHYTYNSPYGKFSIKYTVFENHIKGLIQHCERSELRLLSSGQKLIQNAKNGQFWRVSENLNLAVKQCYQTGQF